MTTKPRIAIVIGSTRPGRYADKAAGWMLKQTQARNDIEAELVDLRDHPMPFFQVYEDRFERPYGFWRPYLKKVIDRYLECGDLHHGFARVKCRDCHHEYLLAFSCKRRHFCPSCHQKRVVEFGEWLCSHVLKKVPHRHFVFSIPKILRRYFLGACPRPDRGTGIFFPI